MEIHVNDKFHNVFCRTEAFFDKEVHAEVIHNSKDLKKIEAVVVVEFVALHIEVKIQSWQDRTTVTLKDMSRSDVVRMHRLYEQLKEIFAWQTKGAIENVSPWALQLQLLPLCSFFDEFDGAWVDSQTMHDRVEALLNHAISCSADVRVEGAQELASWAEGCQQCRVHIAEALLKKDSQAVEALVQTSNLPLAEAYPLAATLHHTLLCPDAVNKLRNSCIARDFVAPGRLSNTSTPAIVVKEFFMAARCLDKVSP